MQKSKYNIFHLLSFFYLSLGICNLSYGQDKAGNGIYQYSSDSTRLNKTIPVHYYIPEGDINNMSCQIIMHGASRNAESYLAGWKEKADQYGLILIAPEFANDQFTIGEYIEGMMISDKDHLKMSEYTLFHLLDDLFLRIRKELNLKQSKFNIYGHSAGGQFVHRYLFFHDSPYVASAVAANPGWYTYPDDNMAFPYGSKGLFDNNEEKRSKYYRKNMIVLVGTADTLRTGKLRVNEQADAQGLNRFERGKNYFNSNRTIATSHKMEYNWKLSFVEEVGHNHKLMSPVAADLLYSNKK